MPSETGTPHGRAVGMGRGLPAGAAAMACLCVIAGFHSTRGEGTDNAQPNRIRLMSFNIRYGSAADGPNEWPKRRGLLLEVLRAHPADVIGLQEALRFQLDEIGAALPEYARVGVGRDDGESAGEHAAILFRAARFELLDQGTFWFSDTPERAGSIGWGARLPRICTWAQFRDRDSGQVLHVANVHLDHQSAASREKSAALLLSRATHWPAPVVIMGDFNSAEDQAPLQRMEAAGFVDSFRVVRPHAADVGTFHGWSGRTTGAKIDYVLVPKGMRVLSAEILHDHEDDRYPSDHFPVTATIAPAG